jgi:acyl transferase domain-containing protein
MNTTAKSLEDFSPEKRALLAKRLRSSAGNTQSAVPEPIAITGMACRFPGGADSPERFWQHLREGRDAISDIPPERWDRQAFSSSDQAAAGKMITSKGGFLDQIDLFDADFFGIAPKEAARMDPQQRLFLEVAWEALEDAGLAVDRLSGGRVGVFTGIYSSDHAALELASPHQIDAYTAISAVHCMVPNRLSYLLDFQGPSLAIDTACSSSLVALHLACQSLRQMECDLAVVGGVNLLLSPVLGIAFSKWGFLSPDGCCKTFDASANGYVRSEGCAVVVLKRLSDALSDRDPVQALVLGSAVNQDGRTTRLTAPNMHAQRRVIQQALAEAQVSPEEITYVETHGTGTSIGDPIEIEALTEALGQARQTSSSCVLGAVKTNIGHLETAAGMAGLLKVVLSMRHAEIPANLHFQRLNPHIHLDQTPFVLPVAPHPWPASPKGRRCAGVSSFGAGGTNAHAVLCEAAHVTIPEGPETPDEGRAYLLPISARSSRALYALAQKYYQFLTAPSASPELSPRLYDLCYSASWRRSHHPYRLAAVGQSRQELAERLAAILQDATMTAPTFQAKSTKRKSGVVFIFPGQGAQWIGMGRDLFATEPVFREMLLRCSQAMQPYLDQPLQDLLLDDQQVAYLEDISCLQPVLFSLQVSLVALWRSWGIEPVALVGHSMGEIAAAYTAGILSLEDAARIICLRSRLLRRVRGSGAMLVVGLSLEQAYEALADRSEHVSVAASNSPRSTVLSGDPEVLRAISASLTSQNVFCQWVKVDVASHSPQMDPLRADLLALLADIRPQTGTIPLYSTVTGQVSAGEMLDAGYWVRNLREPVLFAPVIQQLLQDSHDVFLEISPHPILLPAIEQCIQQDVVEYTLLPSLRRAEPERGTMLASLGELYVRGLFQDWKKLYPSAGRWVPLPSYPWQYQRFESRKPQTTPPHSPWLTEEQAGQALLHPFPGRSLYSPLQAGMYFWELEISLEHAPYLADHRVQDTVLFPAASSLDLAFSAARNVFGAGTYIVKDIAFDCLLALSQDTPSILQLALTLDGPEQASFRFFSQSAVAWQTHTTGSIQRLSEVPVPPPAIAPAQIQQRCQQSMEGSVYYQSLQQIGQHYGPQFQTLARLWRRDGEALALLGLSQELRAELDLYQLHPVLLDACFHVLLATLPAAAASFIYVPVSLGRVQVYERPRATEELWWYGQLLAGGELGGQTIKGNLYLVNEEGRVLLEVAQVLGQQFHPRDQLQPRQLPQNITSWVYRQAWLPAAPTRATQPSPEVSAHWLLFLDQNGTGQRLHARLLEHHASCTLVSRGASFALLEPGHYTIRPSSLEDMRSLLRELAAPCTGIIYLWGLDLPDFQETTDESLQLAQELSSFCLLHLIQALDQRKDAARTRLWLITCNAQQGGGECVNAFQAPLWGLGRVIAQEHPELHCTCVDLSSRPDETEYDALYQELTCPDQEDQIILRSAQRRVARLQPVPFTQTQPPLLRKDATYLVTGGLGGIGLRLARWLAENGARHLALVSRHGPSESASQQIQELTARGVRVYVMQADVSRQQELSQVLASLQASFPPLRGVFHAAGVLDDGILLQQNKERFAQVLAPRIAGSWNLHVLTRDLPLDYFVLFSSASSLLGSPGQGSYAAGNAFLDALAQSRAARHQPALSINWGPWGEVGMATRADREAYLTSRGFESMSSETALAILAFLLKQRSPQFGVLPLRWETFFRLFPTSSQAPLLSAFLPHASLQKTEQQVPELLRLLEETPAEKCQYVLVDALKNLVSSVLGLAEAQSVDIRRGFFEMGMNSLMAVDLRNRLQSALGPASGGMPTTIIFDYPTIESLAAYLTRKVAMPTTIAEARSQDEDQQIATLLSAVQDLSPDALSTILNDKG